MRVDYSSINPKSVNPYNAAADKATSARRSFQVRKKLAKRSASTPDWTRLDHVSMIGPWMNGARGQATTKNQLNTGGSGKDSKFR